MGSRTGVVTGTKHVQPTLDNVLIEPIIEDKSKGGIIIPPSVNDAMKPAGRGVVLAIGPGKWEYGKFVGVTVPVGAEVYYHTYPSGVSVDAEGKRLQLIAERQVVGVVNE